MLKTLRIAAVAAASSIAMLGAAYACPAGYHATWINGNKVCQHNTGGNGKLIAKPQRSPSKHDTAKNTIQNVR